MENQFRKRWGFRRPSWGADKASNNPKISRLFEHYSSPTLVKILNLIYIFNKLCYFYRSRSQLHVYELNCVSIVRTEVIPRVVSLRFLRS